MNKHPPPKRKPASGELPKRRAQNSCGEKSVIRESKHDKQYDFFQWVGDQRKVCWDDLNGLLVTVCESPRFRLCLTDFGEWRVYSAFGVYESFDAWVDALKCFVESCEGPKTEEGGRS